MNPAMLIPLQLLLTVSLQVLFFQNLTLWNGWGILAFHALGILLLPLNTRPVVLLVVSALVGASVDFFAYGGGLFTSSAITMATFLPFINRLLAPREGYEVTDEPTIKSMGIQWFSVRTFAALSIHNLWLFSLEAGRWSLMFTGWGKALTSSFLGLFLFAAVLQLVQAKRKKR
jgi:hypothetical protein